MSEASVVAIHLATEEGAPVFPVDSVRAVAGAGLEGDRYFIAGAKPEQQLTLIEAEEIEALAARDGIQLAPGESRRQITTRGVRLNPLVGRRFTVGDVECRGIELCEPCSYLQKLLEEPQLMRAMVHRAGLNAEIISGGEIAVGAPIVVLEG